MQNATKIDFYSFRAKDNIGLIKESLGAVFSENDAQVSLRENKSGWQGYESSSSILLGDKPVGLLAYGGEFQRGWAYVGITGDGCSWVNDWERAQNAPSSLCQGYELKRVDIALDVFNNPHSFDEAYQAYLDGRFNHSRTGRPPTSNRYLGGSIYEGNTLNVGGRSSDKKYRGYEKGKQILGKKISSALMKDPDSVDFSSILGEQISIVKDGKLVSVDLLDWFRHEVEFKPKTTKLPDDIISNRDLYFAGSYPYLKDVLGISESSSIKLSRSKLAELFIEKSAFNINSQYGSTLYTLLVYYKGDVGKVWEKIVGNKHNQKLIDLGVLMEE